MASKNYRHIIWDWNGTLLDDAWLCVDVMNGVLGRRGMPLLTQAKYRELFDFPVKEYYRRMGFDFEKESFEISGTEFIEDYESRRHEAKLQPQARETLAAVAGQGATQSLLSAYKQETLDELTEDLDVGQFFMKVIGQDNHYAYGKIESGRRWVDHLHYGPHEVLFVGDTAHDHEVAEAIGTDCVLIPAGHHSRERLEKCAVPVLDSLPDVLEFISDGEYR